uniref:Uncharacterized protein n=1 Tax=Rhizophora mucronata TaxID=61149 RepID=A0A2P2N2Y0_RHIMU
MALTMLPQICRLLETGPTFLASIGFRILFFLNSFPIHHFLNSRKVLAPLNLEIQPVAEGASGWIWAEKRE